MNSVRIVQSNPRSMTVQVYNAQVIVKRIDDTYFQVECNLSTPIGLVPCEKGATHLCWHVQRAVDCVLGVEYDRVTWFEQRSLALWMWAGNSEPMSLVRVESKMGQHGWAVVEGMLSGMEKVAMDVMQSKGA